MLARFAVSSCLLFGVVTAAQADDRARCLTRDQQRAKIAAHAVVPLSKAMRVGKARRGEVVRANLCERGGKLVYVLTVLARDGKVARVTVDAGTGTVISGR